jgi:hypothetical protein
MTLISLCDPSVVRLSVYLCIHLCLSVSVTCEIALLCVYPSKCLLR